MKTTATYAKLTKSFVLLLFAAALLSKDQGRWDITAANHKRATIDGDPSRIREVLVSQQMFVTKFSPGKRKLAKGLKDVDFKAELKGVFKVVYMDKDTTITVTDWIRCPNDACPVMKTYNYGTAGYDSLDTMIAISKQNSLDIQKRFGKMVTKK